MPRWIFDDRCWQEPGTRQWPNESSRPFQGTHSGSSTVSKESCDRQVTMYEPRQDSMRNVDVLWQQVLKLLESCFRISPFMILQLCNATIVQTQNFTSVGSIQFSSPNSTLLVDRSSRRFRRIGALNCRMCNPRNSEERSRSMRN